MKGSNLGTLLLLEGLISLKELSTSVSSQLRGGIDVSRNTPYCEEYEGSPQACQLRLETLGLPISHVPANVGGQGE